MTSVEFNAALVGAGHTVDSFAAVVKYNPRYVRQWRTGYRRIPSWVAPMLDLMREKVDAG